MLLRCVQPWSRQPVRGRDELTLSQDLVGGEYVRVHSGGARTINRQSSHLLIHMSVGKTTITEGSTLVSTDTTGHPSISNSTPSHHHVHLHLITSHYRAPTTPNNETQPEHHSSPHNSRLIRMRGPNVESPGWKSSTALSAAPPQPISSAPLITNIIVTPPRLSYWYVHVRLQV